jgi:hypothetical protein
MKISNNKSQISNSLKSPKQGNSFSLIFNPSSFILYLFLIFNLSSLILISCGNESTNPRTLTFNGRVSLEGEINYGGVNVSLYPLVDLDSNLVEINQLYPGIGVWINQETEFNPRQNTPAYSTTSDGLGNWRIEDVPVGSYNVVAEKEGFGWQIAYEENSGRKIVFNLKKIKTYTGSQAGLIQFQDDFIEVPANTTFEINSQVFFVGSNYIVLSNGADINFEGIFGEDADTRIYFINLTPDTTSTIEFDQQLNLQLTSIYAGPGIRIRISNSDFILAGSVIRGNITDACRISQSDGLLENNIFQGNASGVKISAPFRFAVQRNIFLKEGNDLEIFAADSILIEDNLFREAEVNLSLIRTNGLVQYNNFEQSGQNIEIAELSNLDISHNSMVFSGNNLRLNRSGDLNNAIDLISSFNNFVETGLYAFYLEDRSVRVPVLAKNNFWDTNIRNEIAGKIFDKYDDPGYNTNQYVIFQPFIYRSIEDAGIGK